MFRFTIRELVLLTLVVAMGVGWWLNWLADRRQLERASSKSEMLREELQLILYHYEQDTGKRIGIQLPDGEFIRSKEPKGLLLSGRG
jgi:hypothetical protein